jgi:DNA-binding HxlR family transcriptional regulator
MIFLNLSGFPEYSRVFSIKIVQMFYVNHKYTPVTSKSQVNTSYFKVGNAELEFLADFYILRPMKSRSYNQFCALAYALDIVGERWTLLIIRELLTGPRRFKDLTEGLPYISTNLLAERLKSLEQQGLLGRRVLPPPAGSTVYELTPLGRALEEAVLELGKWGSRFLPPSLEGLALPSLGAATVAIKAFFHPQQAQGSNETYELHLGHEILQVQVKDGELHVQQGQALKADVRFHTHMSVFMGLFSGQLEPGEAISGGLITIQGDPGALRRFLALSSVPGSPENLPPPEATPSSVWSDPPPFDLVDSTSFSTP